MEKLLLSKPRLEQQVALGLFEERCKVQRRVKEDLPLVVGVCKGCLRYIEKEIRLQEGRLERFAGFKLEAVQDKDCVHNRIKQ